MQKLFGTEKINPITETFTIFAEERRLNKSPFVQDLGYDFDDNTTTILSQAISSGKTNQQALQAINFNFLINSDFLSKLNKEIEFTNESVRSITMIVYFNAMSFIYTSPENLHTIDSEILFYILNSLKICLVEITALSSNLRQESNAFFFYSVLKTVFSDKSHATNLLSIQNLKLIQEYLQIPYNKLESTFTPIFVKTCDRIFNFVPTTDSEKSEIELFRTQMFENLYQFLSEGRSFVTIDDCKSDIFGLIQQEIKKFNDSALKILAWMTYNAKLEELIPVFVSLPHNLINHMSTLEKDKIPQFESQKEFDFDFSKFEENPKKENKYTFIVSDTDHKSFPNGIEALPIVFFQKFEPLTDLFQPETKDIINKLENLLKDSQENFSLNFFNSFPEAIKYYADESNNDFKLFPLIYAAYLILLKPYSLTKNLLDSQKSAWTVDFIFNPKHLIFADDYLCPLMNRFRNEVFDMLIYTDPNRLIQMFNPESPFLYAEHLGRILSKSDFESVSIFEKDKEKIIKNEKKDKEKINKNEKNDEKNINNIDENNINDRNMLVFKKLADNEEFCKDVIKVARQLQQINLKYHSNLISKMRNCVFLFTFNIARYKRFESKSFGPYFFDFLFESEITDVIIKIIEKYYIFYSKDHVNDDAVIGRILKALNICSERSEDKLYSNLAIKLTKMVHNIMHHNLNSIHYFSSLFDVIMKNFMAKPSVELLDPILAIILFISMVNNDFCPKTTYLQKMADFIKDFKNNESNNKFEKRCLYNRIMCLLKKSTQFTQDQKDQKRHQLFLIRRPQFIPFLIASFGSTKKFAKIIRTFTDICKVSWSNIIQCHRGCFDTILILFLTQRKENATIFFGGLQIEMKMAFLDQKVSILQLLYLINSFISSYSNASYYLNYCSSNTNVENESDNYFENLLQNKDDTENKNIEEAIQTFMVALNFCKKFQMQPCLMISSIPTNSIGTGLTSSFAQSTFSICFFLRLDLISINENDSEIILFDIRDSKSTSLALFLIGTRLFLRYDHNYVRTQVKLVDWPRYTFKESRKDPLISSSDWHFVNLTVIENVKTHSISVKTTIDFDKPAISEMSKIIFHNMNSNDEKLTIEFVKATNHKELYSRYEYAFISQFRVFNRKLIKKERIQLALRNYNYVNDDIKIDIKVKQAKIIPKNLIRQFENVSLLFKFLDAFENNKSLQFFSCLRIIFDSSIVTQNNIQEILFNQSSSNNNFTKKLSEILTEICFFSTKNSIKEGQKLTIQLYLTAYSIMEVITDDCFRDKWLQDILLNLFIWAKVFNPLTGNKEINSKKSCIDNTCLPFIINHWISVLFVNCTDLFKSNLCLTTILNQMEKLNIEHPKSNESLLKFSVMVSLLNFDQFDTSFKNYYPQLRDLQMVNFYLDVLLKTTKSVKLSSHPTYYSLLYTTFNSSDSPITLLKIIKIIYLMEDCNEKESNNENAVYDEFLKLLTLIEKKNTSVIQTLFLIIYANKTEISNDDEFNADFVYENSVLNEYPNLFSILIMISILLSKSSKKSVFSKAPEKMVNVLHAMMTKKIKISTNGIWYIFPIILAFKIKDMTNILTFLSHNIGQSTDSARHIFYLLNLFESIQNNRDKNWKNSIIESIHYIFLSFLPHYGYKITPEYLELCLYCYFWHLDVIQPSKDIYMLFKDEGNKMVNTNTPNTDIESVSSPHKSRRRNSYDESMNFSDETLLSVDVSNRNATDLIEIKNQNEVSIVELNHFQFKIGLEPCQFEINLIKDLASDFLTQNKKYTFYYQVANKSFASDSLFHWPQSNTSMFDTKNDEDYIKLIEFFADKSDKVILEEEKIITDLKQFEAINDTLEKIRNKYQESFNKTINSFFSRIKNKIKEVDAYFSDQNFDRFPNFNKAEYNIISTIFSNYDKRRNSNLSNSKSIDHSNIQLDYKKSRYLSRFCPFKLKSSLFVDYNDKSNKNEQRMINNNNNKPTISSKKTVEKPQPKFFTQPKYFLFEKTQYKANWIRIYKQEKVIIQFGKKGLFFSNKDSKIEKVIRWQETTMIFQISQTSIEFIVCDKKSYLFEFESNKIASNIVSKIKDYFQDINQTQIKLKNKNKQNYQDFRIDTLLNPKVIMDSSITNFDYLIRLNYLKGRSFNLRDKYPIFPQFFDDFQNLKIKNIDNFVGDEEYYFFKAYNGDKNNKFNIDNYSQNDSAINFNPININDVVNYISVPPEFYILPEVIIFNQEQVESSSDKDVPISKSYDDETSGERIDSDVTSNSFDFQKRNKFDRFKSGTKIRNSSIYFGMEAKSSRKHFSPTSNDENEYNTREPDTLNNENENENDTNANTSVIIKRIKRSNWYSNRYEFCSKLLDFLETDEAREFIKKWEKIVFSSTTDEPPAKRGELSMRAPKRVCSLELVPPTDTHTIKRSLSSQGDSNFLKSEEPISFISLSDFEYCIAVDNKGTIYFYHVLNTNIKSYKTSVLDVKNDSDLDIQFINKYELENFHKLTFIPFNNSTISSNFQYMFSGKNDNYFVSKQVDANSYIIVDQTLSPTESGYSNLYCFASNKPMLLAFDSISMVLKIFDSKSIIDVPFFCQSLFNMSSNLFSLASTNEVFYCESESVIKTVFSDFTHYSEKEITYLMASSEFGIVVYSTIDGFVHIVSFSSNPQEIFSIRIISSQKVDDLNDEILSITITKSLGYIVIHSTRALTILTVNGSVICFKEPLKTEIVTLSSFTSQKGIDYICFIDEKMKINFFKAADATFCLSDSECPRVKKSEVASSIRYDLRKKAFLVQTMSCKVFVFPYDISHSSEIERRIQNQ